MFLTKMTNKLPAYILVSTRQISQLYSLEDGRYFDSGSDNNYSRFERSKFFLRDRMRGEECGEPRCNLSNTKKATLTPYSNPEECDLSKVTL